MLEHLLADDDVVLPAIHERRTEIELRIVQAGERLPRLVSLRASADLDRGELVWLERPQVRVDLAVHHDPLPLVFRRRRPGVHEVLDRVGDAPANPANRTLA